MRQYILRSAIFLLSCMIISCSESKKAENMKSDQKVSVPGPKAIIYQTKKDYSKLIPIILSDDKNVVRKLFGVPKRIFKLVPGRVTYVADRSGKVIYIFDSQTEIQRHVDEAIKIILVLKRTEIE